MNANTSDKPRQPAGIPEGGQWSEQAKARSGLHLGTFDRSRVDQRRIAAEEAVEDRDEAAFYRAVGGQDEDARNAWDQMCRAQDLIDALEDADGGDVADYYEDHRDDELVRWLHPQDHMHVVDDFEDGHTQVVDWEYVGEILTDDARTTRTRAAEAVLARRDEHRSAA